ncbi:MAG: oligosaccharide flippase family protein [Candidatus Njordarchaeia archaeon]
MGDDLLDIAKESAKSSVWLTVGQGIASVIGGIITIFIARILQSELYGLYAITLIPINIGFLIGNWGMSSAVAKYISQDYPNKLDNVSKWASTSYIFELLNGLVISLLILLGSDMIGIYFLGKPQAAPLIRYAAFMVLFNCLFAVSYGILNGLYATKYIATAQITGAVMRMIVTFYLIFTGWGVVGALLGFFSYYFIAALMSIMFTIRELARRHIKLDFITRENLTNLIKYGTPLTVNAFFQVVGLNIFNAIASHYSNLAELGNYFAASAILTILAVFTAPITQALIPSFSKVSALNRDHLQTTFKTSVFLTALLLSPTIFAIMGLARPLILMVYGVGYPTAPLYLSFVSLILVPSILGTIPISSLFLGIGETKNIFFGGFTAFIVSLLSAILVIPTYRILGLISTLIIFNFSIWFIYLIIIKREYDLVIDFAKISKIIFSSLIMLVLLLTYSNNLAPRIYNLLYGPLSLIYLNHNVVIYLIINIIGSILGLIVYFVVLGLIRVLTPEELELIENISKSLGPLHTAAVYLLAILKTLSRHPKSNP